MDGAEQAQLAALRVIVRARIEAEEASSWEARRIAASDLLAAVNHTWWAAHGANPTAFEPDLARLNSLAGWTGQHAQVGEWLSSKGQTMLMPPKFFGGDPLALDEMFVASISLNHAILEDASFAIELRDQQTEQATFLAHRLYFDRDYAYKRFFGARGLLLHAYATRAGLARVPEPVDWRALNSRFALYIEAFATRSRRFKLPSGASYQATLAREVFVCALNAVAHEIVLHLLRPRRILLAGRATWDAWPDEGLASHGERVALRQGRACPVFRHRARSSIYASEVVVVRTNFLRTVYGPNTNDELMRLGRDVVA